MNSPATAKRAGLFFFDVTCYNDYMGLPIPPIPPVPPTPPPECPSIPLTFDTLDTSPPYVFYQCTDANTQAFMAMRMANLYPIHHPECALCHYAWYMPMKCWCEPQLPLWYTWIHTHYQFYCCTDSSAVPPF